MPNKTPIQLEITYPDTPKGMSDAEWHARVDLAAAYRLTHFYGWTSVVYNHITLRIPGTDTFLINPFGLTYDEITASNLTCAVSQPKRQELMPSLSSRKPAATRRQPFISRHWQASRKIFFLSCHPTTGSRMWTPSRKW